MRYIGLDAGSVSVKAVVLAGDNTPTPGIILASDYRPHRGHAFETSISMIKKLASDGSPYSIAVTGSAGRLLASAIGAESVNEIVAQAHATRRLHPHIKSIIEMGGEDSKLIVLGRQGVEDFAMNSVCAAGTGSFLDQQAERLGLAIEELGRMAQDCKKPPRVAGRCSVFAKSDMIHLQQIATPVEDIVAGLCFAVARNFKGSIMRGRPLEGPVGFQGGVAANPGMRRAFKEVLGLDELFVPEEFALMGAIGAAMKQMEEGRTSLLDLRALEKAVERESGRRDGHAPLRSDTDRFHDRHIRDSRDRLHPLPLSDKILSEKIPAYLGIDIGSISTNLAIVDSNGRLLAKRYLMTAGRPIEAVRKGLTEIEAEAAHAVEIKGVGTTGSGRYMIADYLGADIVKNEITAQATAAAFIDPSVDTIFEIGGQDSKYISLRGGAIVDFEMNKACAAGTGSFLEEQAEKLSVSVKGEFQSLAFDSRCPTKLGERCTVFMENSLMANLQRGAARDDLLAGLSYSIVQNYLNRVVAGKPVGERIFFQGGVAFNKSVVAAFEKHLGREIFVPENHDVTGAIGMALIAMRHMLASESPKSKFKGFGRARAGYGVSTFECKGCANLCEINMVKVEGDDRKLFYGGRCEKYDIARKDRSSLPEDLFRFRDDLLWSEVRPPRGNRPVIGVPYVFYFNEMLPFWAKLLDELGFDVHVSPRPDRRIIDTGLQSALSEACFPVKVALGHVRHLMDAGVEAILCPSIVNLAQSNGNGSNGNGNHPNALACPHTQTIPYVTRAAFPGANILSPVINFRKGTGHIASEIAASLAGFGVSKSRARAALEKAMTAQDEFYARLKAKGRETLAGIKGQAVVIVGRSYNAFEKGMNLQIPEKLATLGVRAIPMDMLPTEDEGITEHWPNMYWRAGQNILKAARIIARDGRLHPIFIGNFSCGPDSFILKYFKEELGGKPFLHIEIDEHSADAGAITRCEAFLDSIQNARTQSAPKPSRVPRKRPSIRERKVYIPRMSDHAFALESAFLRAGLDAEVLPESTREAVELGMKHVSGKECYPCVVTTGDMLLKAHSPVFEPERSAFFMPSGSGPCRFGQYNVFHQRVLQQAGFDNVPVFAPNQDAEFYRDLGEVGKGFALDCFRGVVAVTLLQKCLHESRPYETTAGSADALYAEYLSRVRLAAAGRNGSVEDALAGARQAFSDLGADRSARRPLIGIVGEIFVRSNRFSNEHLARRIESLGGEVWLAAVDEWVYYVNAMALRHALSDRDWSLVLDALIKKFAMDRTERGYGRAFEGFLSTLHEPTTRQLMRKASVYVDDSFEGETVLSIGKTVDLASRGASGIVNAMPFGCMPGTIVTALLRAVSRDLKIPCISIPYDGTESTSSALQLEAFMEQARGMARERA